MKYATILLLALLTGCSTTVPVKTSFPNAVPELMKRCEDLKKIEGDRVAITDMLKVVVTNYTLYYECSTKVEGWQDWYTEQKRIHDEATK